MEGNEWVRARWGAYGPWASLARMSWFRCEWCGKHSHRNLSGTNKAKGYEQRWCSMACRTGQAASLKSERDAARKIAVAERRRSRRKAPVYWAAVLHRQTAKVVTCDCGVQFCPLFKVGKHMKRCPPCQEKECRDQRAAARKAGKVRLKTQWVQMVKPSVVFERDGWKCYICGVATPKALRGTSYVASITFR